MSPDEFATKIKAKYPQYNNMSNQELTTKMLAKYPQYQSQIKSTDTQQPIESQLSKTGMFDPFMLGGLLRSAENSTESFGRMAGEGIGDLGRVGAYGVNKAVDALTGQNTADKNLIAQKPMLMNPQNPADQGLLSGNLQQVAPEALGRSLNFAANAARAKGAVNLATNLPEIISGAGNMAENITNLPKFLTQGTINKAMTDAKDESVSQGAVKSWKDIVTEAQQKLSEGQYRFRPDLQREVGKVLATRTPAATTISTDFGPSEAAPEGLTTQTLSENQNANDLHDLRQALDKSIPKNAWNNPTTRSIGVEANQFVRGIVSDSLHEIAPKTKVLDAINHLYYNPAFSKIGIPFVGGINSPVSGIPTAIINALAGLVGVTEGNKILKGVFGGK